MDMKVEVITLEEHEEMNQAIKEKEALMSILDSLKEKVMAVNTKKDACWNKIKDRIQKEHTAPEGYEFYGLHVNQDTREITVELRSTTGEEEPEENSNPLAAQLGAAMARRGGMPNLG